MLRDMHRLPEEDNVKNYVRWSLQAPCNATFTRQSQWWEVTHVGQASHWREGMVEEVSLIRDLGSWGEEWAYADGGSAQAYANCMSVIHRELSVLWKSCVIGNIKNRLGFEHSPWSGLNYGHTSVYCVMLYGCLNKDHHVRHYRCSWEPHLCIELLMTFCYKPLFSFICQAENF